LKNKILIKLNRFVQGNFPKNNTNDVKEIIETCSEVRFKVKRLRECDMILVAFDKSVGKFTYSLVIIIIL